MGEVLREARVRMGLTLAAVAARSGGRFKASILGGYERGEKQISLERFWAIARFYGVPPDQLLGRVMDRMDPQDWEEQIIDLTAAQRPEVSVMERESASRSLIGVAGERPGAVGS